MWQRRRRDRAQGEQPGIPGDVDARIDDVLARLPPGVAAEVMVHVPEATCLVTVAIRPDHALLLPTRLRAGQGIAGRVLESQQAIGGRVDSSMGAPRLLRTRSMLAVPMWAGHASQRRLVGVMNLESADEGALTLHALSQLDRPIAEIAARLGKFPMAAFREESSIIHYLLDKVEKELLFILDPGNIPEVYHQIRQTAARLTSQADVVATILLRLREAHHLEFADEEQAEDTEGHDWIVPVPNVGEHVSLPTKWDLRAEPSITSEVLRSGKSLNIKDVTDASVRGRRKPVPAPYDRGSELNVPFGEADQRFGTIILLSARPNAFTDADEAVVASIARYLGIMTRRIEIFREAQRPQGRERDRVKLDIRTMIDPLYTSDDFMHLRTTRDAVLQRIAGEAKQGTRSEVAAVVLEELASDGTVELVWNPHHYVSDLVPSPDALQRRPFRLKTDEGLVGAAFTAGEPVLVQDVSNPAEPRLRNQYVDAFPGIQSELVIPLQRRNRRWGVIDVESSEVEHYTQEHVRWLRFLADAAVDALEAVDLAARRWFQDRLSALDKDIAWMRESKDLVAIQTQREPLLRKVVDETRELTGATTTQIYVVVNAQYEGTRIDTLEGALGAVAASPWAHYADADSALKRHIKLNEGMAGHVVKYGEVDFFKDLGDRPARHLKHIIEAKSALVVPITDGDRVIAILNMESEEPRWCGNLEIDIARYGARLAGSILVGYRLAMERLQAAELRRFALSHQQLDTPNVTQYMRQVLQMGGQLTASPDKRRWAEMALIGGDRIEYVVSMTFEDGRVAEDWNQPLSYSVYRRVIQSRQPCLVPNVMESARLDDRLNLPWKDAKSLLCVPLVVEEPGMDPTTIGLLTVASSLPYYLNDGDKDVLELFSQSVTHGLQDIARLYSRVTLMFELKTQFRNLGRPTSDKLEDLREAIRSIPDDTSPVEAAIEVRRQFREIEASLQLVEHLPHWYLILSNYYPLDLHNPASHPSEARTLERVIEDLKQVTTTFVNNQVGGDVVWRWTPTDVISWRLTVSAQDEDQQMLKAAIFGCIASASAASRKGDVRGHDIYVRVSADSPRMLRLSVEYVGKAISTRAFTLAPEYIRDDDAKLNTMEVPERRLIEVRRIAKLLGGDVEIQHGDDRHHAIDLLLPCFPPR